MKRELDETKDASITELNEMRLRQAGAVLDDNESEAEETMSWEALVHNVLLLLDTNEEYRKQLARIIMDIQSRISTHYRTGDPI